jgi:hypothetical protein
MTDQVFRSAPEPVQPRADLPEPEINDKQVMSGETDNEPIEIRETGGRSIVLDALGIDENLVSLPEEDKANVSEVRNYVLDIVKSKGLNPTVGAFKKTLDGLKGEMGLDEEAEPSIVLDRIAGVCKAWRNLSFINDPDEKRTIFLKLASLKSSKDMNKQIFKIMEQYQVWR